jgi:putative multiple sugar transport system substrate-binding protein
MKKERFIAILIVLVVILTLITGCNGNNIGDEGVDDTGIGDGTRLIGISMPTRYSPRWIDDGNNLVEQLEDLGFETILSYGDDVVADQVDQINEMIDRGAEILVIAAIDGSALSGVLARAAREDIVVIAYDRLIMETENVNYYTTFDNFAVGEMQANSLLMGLGILDGAEGPFNIELFGGSMDDNNAFIVYDGAMSVLQPLIDDGTLVVRSGQAGMDVVSSLGWSGERAQSRMSELLAEYYTDTRIDAVLSPYDGISIGIINALRDFGYGTPEMPWPVVSGQDATIPSVQSIIDGEQFATIFKDTRQLAATTVRMIQAIFSGDPVPVNDTVTYYNDVMIVPAYLLGIVHVDISNWYAVLIDTEYYSIDEFILP